MFQWVYRENAASHMQVLPKRTRLFLVSFRSLGSCFLSIVLTLRKCHLSKEKMEAIRKAPRPKNKHE
ncbi:hypothetical protein T02_9594 [Trichinella nativa]|uniref:Uncharacterized protein n=1 Tax=Trichinella nativa TaxID=6335 RepID=A0A0V1L2P4_9BILA|nr:hypothetical protein T02_9594 [Trichinella nativa]